MENETIVLYCPQCDKGQRVYTSAARVKCPKCGFIGSILTFRREKKAAAATPASTSGATQVSNPVDTPTVLMSNPATPSGKEEGVLRVVSTGERFVLRSGTQIVGRKHETGHADIAIPCDDMYMSRHHLKIEGVSTAYGMEYRLSDYNSTNKSRLNGVALPTGDIVVLKPGDRIILGRTEVEFLLQPIQGDTGGTLIFHELK